MGPENVQPQTGRKTQKTRSSKGKNLLYHQYPRKKGQVQTRNPTGSGCGYLGDFQAKSCDLSV